MTHDTHFFSPLTELFKGERDVLYQHKMPKSTVNRLLSLGFTPGFEMVDTLLERLVQFGFTQNIEPLATMRVVISIH